MNQKRTINQMVFGALFSVSSSISFASIDFSIFSKSFENWFEI